MAIQNDEPISIWLHQLADGDDDAADGLWRSYFDRLRKFASRRLRDMPRHRSDEEDVALSAFHSFFQGAKADRFPQLNDRDDLWKILITITARKAVAHQRKHFAAKRGGGNVQNEGSDADAFQGTIGSEPTPELLAELEEDFAILIRQLTDATARQIALLKFEGYTNREIAEKLDCSERTVERKLTLVRATWKQHDR